MNRPAASVTTLPAAPAARASVQTQVVAAEAGGKLRNLDVGEVLNGTWRLEEQIGEGGMGRVFLATELKLNRKVAVKALSIDNLDEETVKRFEREAQVMGKLDHPNVVTLYGVGRHRTIPFLVMRYLEGKSLWGVLDEHGERIPLAVMWPIAKQLLAALGYIHQRNMLHRDLKPSNIHIAPSGKLTLLDLGLARGRSSTLTRTGVVWGTPDYMAPEQILGEKNLDGRADLYALGVVLYRMLTGEPPFPDEDEQELMRAHLMKPRPDASAKVPELPPEVGAVIQKAMNLKLEERFQTAEAMSQALERAVNSREPPTRQQPQRAPVETVAARAAAPRSSGGTPLPDSARAAWGSPPEEDEPSTDVARMPAHVAAPRPSSPAGRKPTAEQQGLFDAPDVVTDRGGFQSMDRSKVSTDPDGTGLDHPVAHAREAATAPSDAFRALEQPSQPTEPAEVTDPKAATSKLPELHEEEDLRTIAEPRKPAGLDDSGVELEPPIVQRPPPKPRPSGGAAKPWWLSPLFLVPTAVALIALGIILGRML